MDHKSSGALQEHMLGTYDSLRVGLATIGIALPLVVLLAVGALHHDWLEPSISDYYHTQARLPILTMRDPFVGGLLVAGACLNLYQGVTSRENVAVNLAKPTRRRSAPRPARCFGHSLRTPARWRGSCLRPPNAS